MPGLIEVIELQVLNDLLGNAVLLPDPVFIGLLLAIPNNDGSGVVEPSGFDYGRISVANNLTQWPSASVVDGVSQKTHANDISWLPANGGDWGTIVGAGIFETISSDDLRVYGNLDVNRIIKDTDQFEFLAAIRPMLITLA